MFLNMFSGSYALNILVSLLDNSSLSSFACIHARSLQSCPDLCKHMDCSLPGSSVHKICQARILEWVAVPSSRSSQLRDATHIYSGMQLTSLVSPALVGRFCTTSTTWEAALFIYLMYVQLCPTLCDSVDCSPPGSSVHGIFQARITGVGCQKAISGKTIFKTLHIIRIRISLYFFFISLYFENQESNKTFLQFLKLPPPYINYKPVLCKHLF